MCVEDKGVDAAQFVWFVGCDYLQTFMRGCCVSSVFGFGIVREHRTCVGAFNLKPLR